MLQKPMVSKFITTARNNFFVIIITPYCNNFVVITTNFSTVKIFFPFGE